MEASPLLPFTFLKNSQIDIPNPKFSTLSLDPEVFLTRKLLLQLRPDDRQLWMQNQLNPILFTLNSFSEEKGLLSKHPGTITWALSKGMAWLKKKACGGPKPGAVRCDMKGLTASEILREFHTCDPKH